MNLEKIEKSINEAFSNKDKINSDIIKSIISENYFFIRYFI